MNAPYTLDERFKDHVATYFSDTEHLGAPIERLVFRKPGTGNDYIEFLAIGAALIIRGDLYEAIYQVSGRKSLLWWTTTYADYMAGKMRDTTGGRAAASETWDTEQADKQLEEWKAELFEKVKEDLKSDYEIYKLDEGCEEVTFENYLSERIDELREFDKDQRNDHRLENVWQWKFWLEYEPENYTSDEAEWIHFLHEHGTDVFGDCHHEAGTYEIGKKRHPVIDIHNGALKLAVKQLQDKGVELLKIEE